VETFDGEGRYRLSRRLVVRHVALDALAEIGEAKIQSVVRDLRQAAQRAADAGAPLDA